MAAVTFLTLQTISSFLNLNNKKIAKEVKTLAEKVVHIILERMEFIDPIFKKINRGHEICGSVRDNIKICEPNEFDVNILLELPNAKVDINDNHPGYVSVNISDCEGDTALEDLCDANGYVQVFSLQKWFQSLFDKIKINDKSIIVDKHILHISLSQNGPARTLSIEIEEPAMDSALERHFNFSIDVVPGILFNQQTWPFEISPPLACKDHRCIAIPKPVRGSGNAENIYFTPSFPIQESALLNDKMGLKNVLRLLKKVRDRKNIGNFKSYFLKVVAMLAYEEEGDSFWNQPMDDVFIKMLDKIIARLEKRTLPFYWDRKFNMLKRLNSTQIDTMRQQFESVKNEFESKRNTPALIDLFLTKSERVYLKNKLKIKRLQK